jgi:hypothetical protein
MIERAGGAGCIQGVAKLGKMRRSRDGTDRI